MNYIFEDKINFNTALLTALCDESTEQPENICLISHNHLDKDHVTLQCKHSFNYSDILKEVCKQKKSPCIFETQKLIKTQIKCPYCRNIQNGWLPYHPDYDKILHVNWPPSGAFSLKTCQYKIKSGKKKNMHCQNYCMDNYCYKHWNTKHYSICKGKIQTGKRSGLQCTYFVRNPQITGEFCKLHAKR